MRIAIVGASGTLGSATVRAASAAGHQVTAIERSPLHNQPATVTVRHADVLTKRGLRAALVDAEVVIDAVNPHDPSLLGVGTQAILDEARRLGISHYVGISIVGCDRVPAKYLRAKLAQERLISLSPVPWSIVRATQCHELIDLLLSKLTPFAVYPVPAKAKVQPIAADEVGAALLEVATGVPLGLLPDVAGPEIMEAGDLVRLWREALHRRGVMVPLPAWGRVARALVDGAICNPRRAVGRQTFANWLRTRAHRVHVPKRLSEIIRSAP